MGMDAVPSSPKKGSDTGIDVVPSLPKGRVRRYGCFTKLIKGSGMVRLLVPVPVPDPGVFQQSRTRYQGILPRAYRTYQSVGYGCGSRAKLTEVSGYG